MHPIRHLLAPIALLASAACTTAQAETYNTCSTIITSVPTLVTTPGVYCLNHDVSTAITSGNAITISTNNVTIDCNGYKIGGLGAGTGSVTNGIYSDTNRQNITVRNCGIRGFYRGIDLEGGAGHLVEDNRLDNNPLIGILLNGGTNNRVQRNRIYDTGGTPGSSDSDGIFANADVIDNTVAGLFATATDSDARGIVMGGDGTEARDNLVRGLVASGIGQAKGIVVTGTGVTVDRNRVSATALTNGIGIQGIGGSDTFCLGNTVAKFSGPIIGCQPGTDNLTN